MEEKFEVKWAAYNFIVHPFGDLLWHLFWGIVLGISIAYFIFNLDYWGLVLSLIALIFFFHPFFYKPKLMEIKINNEGIFINNKKYNWTDFDGFEIFSNGLRTYVYFLPANPLSFGFSVPIEEFFVDKEDVRKALNVYLDEYKNVVPIGEILFRTFFI
ncbi:MAG: hypothetical protein C4278_01875 [Patescibacteria group bacterium]